MKQYTENRPGCITAEYTNAGGRRQYTTVYIVLEAPKPCKVPAVFPFINFSCKGSFFFSQSSKGLSAGSLRWEHRHMATSVRLVSYILTDLELPGELLVQPHARLARITSWTSQAYSACHNLACKPPQNTCMRTVHLQAHSGQTDSVYNAGRDCSWSTWHLQLADIMYIYTYNFSPQI